MGGILPAVATTAMQTGLELAQQKAASAEAKADTRAQQQQIQQTQEISDRQRRDQLRRALATQRARFGAQGIVTGSGSGAAALSGLEAEADRAETDSQALSNLRIGRLSDQLDWQRQRNLLSASAPAYRGAFSLFQRSLRSGSLVGGE